MPTDPSRLYSKRFYGDRQREREMSAGFVLDALLQVIPRPASVIDIGCGIGSWLVSFREAGIIDITGVDGHWVEEYELAIPREKMRFADLSQPIALGRKFDLAISMEVAEHIPASSAGVYVDTLVGASDMVLFSAAIPGQGGKGHVNEQWLEYWDALFCARDFAGFDVIRPRIWNDHRISVWYRQNTVLFVRSGRVAEAGVLPVQGVRSMVHPELFENLGIRRSAESLFRGVKRRSRTLFTSFVGGRNA